MATSAENKTTADAAIVLLYPEIAGIEAHMDALALLGRLVYVVTIDDPDHASALKKNLDVQLDGLGYTVSTKETTVTIAGC